MKTATGVETDLLSRLSAELRTWTEQPYPFTARERDREEASAAAQAWRDINLARQRLKVTTWDGLLSQRLFAALSADEADRVDELVQLAAAALAAALSERG